MKGVISHSMRMYQSSVKLGDFTIQTHPTVNDIMSLFVFQSVLVDPVGTFSSSNR